MQILPLRSDKVLKVEHLLFLTTSLGSQYILKGVMVVGV
jgi:hypothetical protein